MSSDRIKKVLGKIRQDKKFSVPDVKVKDSGIEKKEIPKKRSRRKKGKKKKGSGKSSVVKEIQKLELSLRALAFAVKKDVDQMNDVVPSTLEKVPVQELYSKEKIRISTELVNDYNDLSDSLKGSHLKFLEKRFEEIQAKRKYLDELEILLEKPVGESPVEIIMAKAVLAYNGEAKKNKLEKALGEGEKYVNELILCNREQFESIDEEDLDESLVRLNGRMEEELERCLGGIKDLRSYLRDGSEKQFIDGLIKIKSADAKVHALINGNLTFND